MKSVKLALAGFTATLVCGVALSLAMVAPAAAYPDGSLLWAKWLVCYCAEPLPMCDSVTFSCDLYR